MRFIGIDLHKRSMTVCVIDKNNGESFIRKFPCSQPKEIFQFFKGLGKFQATIEATATYEWLWELLEPLAQRLVLAHPKKVKIISESMKKTDKHDAYFLAWLLSQDSVPEAHRPSPRQREYQLLVRHRVFLVRECTKVKLKIKSLLANRNIDCKGLYTKDALAVFAAGLRTEIEKLLLKELGNLLETFFPRLQKAEEAIAEFRKSSPEAEKEQHAIVQSVPGAGVVTADVVLSSLGNVKRFPSVKKVFAYAGMAPGIRESDRQRKELGITKEGPRLLRWVLIQAAWRCIRKSPYWAAHFQRLAERRGKKKAIVAIARRLLGVIFTLLRTGQRYLEKALPALRKKPAKMVTGIPPGMAPGMAKG